MAVLTSKCVTRDWLMGWLQIGCIYPGKPIVQRVFSLTLCSSHSLLFHLRYLHGDWHEADYVILPDSPPCTYWRSGKHLVSSSPWGSLPICMTFQKMQVNNAVVQLLQNPYTYAVWPVKLFIFKFLWQSLMHFSSIAASTSHLKACCHAPRLGKPGTGNVSKTGVNKAVLQYK